MVRDLIERSDTQAERRLSALEIKVDQIIDRLGAIERSRAEEKAAAKAVEKERSASSSGWSTAASWVGVAFTVLATLASAAWALFLRGEHK